MKRIGIKQFVQDHAAFVCKTVFGLGPKAYIVASPVHPNLGDQAQLMCLESWIAANYPGHRIIRVPIYVVASHPIQFVGYLSSAFRCRAVIGLMKLFSGRDDLVFGHSGYFMIDHHSGWLAFARVATALTRVKMVIMPQTINFLNPTIREQACRVFDAHPDLTILCRDEVSLGKAKEMFNHCRLLLYPDIVTSLIGSRDVVATGRSGVLLCVRNDVEAHYSRAELEALAARIKKDRVEISDTTIDADYGTVRAEKERLITAYIDYISSFQVVVTDRYHGTIFSLIAGTPVVVIDSTDHKLSSGVKWYPSSYGNRLQFVDNLDAAYERVSRFLSEDLPERPEPFFKENYYDQLASMLNNPLQDG